VTTCCRCGAELSGWEIRKATNLGVAPCWCAGVPRGLSHTLSNVAYATLCDPALTQPVKTHDVIRLVAAHYRGDPRYSMNAALSQGKQFCWGGRALYGLARHGLVPGARSLAEAAYAVAVAAPRALHGEEIDFVLEQFNYRFNADSLLHHLRGYTDNRRGLQFHLDDLNRVHVNSGRDVRHEYNRKVGVCPTHAGFDHYISETLAPRVEHALVDRIQRLATVNGTALDVGGDRVEFR
jgi:hypothetical protein